MNLIEKYENLKFISTRLMREGKINAYLKILKEINLLEKQIERSLQWN
jgi:hypothetical protein